MKMELVRFLVLILVTSLVLLLHNSCAHHQGRKLKVNSLVVVAPAKMGGLVHRHSSSAALGGNQQHHRKYQNGKTSEANTRDSSEKDERNVNNDEASDREVMNMMLHRDYSPQGKNKGRRKPPINNHNHKH